MIALMNQINNMGYREYYIHRTGLDLNKNIHIHHIDMNRDNCNLSNLVHIDKIKHLKYHTYIRYIRSALRRKKETGLNFDSMYGNKWALLYCFPAKKHKYKWWEEITEIETELYDNLNKRNELSGIISISEFVTEEENKMLEYFIKERIK